jgi:hypothetical protein
MYNEADKIKQYAADVVEYARKYPFLDESGPLPLREIASTDNDAQKLIDGFKELSEIDGFIEKLNVKINNAETNYNIALANKAISGLDDSFNVAANPDLTEAITDYVVESTPHEVREVSTYDDGTPRISVNSQSLDVDINTNRKVKSALKQDWEDAGINFQAKVGNRGAQLAAKALKAHVLLHNNKAMGG